MNKRDPSPNHSEGQPPKSNYLPQFTRFFSAPLAKRLFSMSIKGAIWTLLLFLLLTNVALSNRGVASYFEATFRRISGGGAKQPNVLGTTSKSSNASPTIGDLKKQYDHWEKIVAELPDYRDGHFALATLAYQLGDTDASMQHLMIVKEMDPNFPGLKQLEAVLVK